jgi:hypothetical protein
MGKWRYVVVMGAEWHAPKAATMARHGLILSVLTPYSCGCSSWKEADGTSWLASALWFECADRLALCGGNALTSRGDDPRGQLRRRLVAE